MVRMVERRGYTFSPGNGSRGYLPFDVRAVDGLGRLTGFGDVQLANINVNPKVCAAVAALVGAAGGFFGARGALKGKGLSKKKLQQQIAMYAVGATAVAGLVGYFLCRRPPPEPVPPPPAPAPQMAPLRRLPEPDPLR